QHPGPAEQLRCLDGFFAGQGQVPVDQGRAGRTGKQDRQVDAGEAARDLGDDRQRRIVPAHVQLVTGPVRCSVPPGPCCAGTAVTVTPPTWRASHAASPAVAPSRRAAAVGVVKVSGAVATYARPPWSRLSGCWSCDKR